MTRSSVCGWSKKDQQFLYETDGRLVVMDMDTFEQIELDAEILGDRRPFLQDGMTVTVEYYGEEALNIDAAAKRVICKVVETEPVVKGQTAANSFKPALLDNGVRVLVPPFVGQDEDIRRQHRNLRVFRNAPDPLCAASVRGQAYACHCHILRNQQPLHRACRRVTWP